MIKAVIFDLDQTLLDRDATFANYLSSQYDHFQLSSSRVTKSEYIDFILSIDDHGYTKKGEVFQRACREILSSTVSSKTLLAHYQEEYGKEPVLYEGVKGALERLKKIYQIGLITNGRVQSQMAKIEISGIKDYFDSIQISEAVGVEKPDPLIFQIGIQSLDRKPEECVYIGDHPKNDVEGAKACGMKGIWLRKAYYDPPIQMDGEIESIVELQNWLETLNDAPR